MPASKTTASPVSPYSTAARYAPESGKAVIAPVRLKRHAVPSIEARCAELGLNRSEYFRTLIHEDIGVIP